jgi:hypothetical protein
MRSRARGAVLKESEARGWNLPGRSAGVKECLPKVNPRAHGRGTRGLAESAEPQRHGYALRPRGSGVIDNFDCDHKRDRQFARTGACGGNEHVSLVLESVKECQLG